MSHENIIDAKARLEEAILAMQGAQVDKQLGVTVMAALKPALNRIRRLEAMLEDKFTMRDKFAMNIVVHVLAKGTTDPKKALEMAYKLADEAIEVRR